MDPKPYAYATIGTNGTDPVVWGFGATPEFALMVAKEELRKRGYLDRWVWPQDLLTVEVTADQAQRIWLSRGVQTAESLGIPLPGHWLETHGPKFRDYPKALTLEEGSPWYYVQGVRYCKVCRTRRCVRQAGGSIPCDPDPGYSYEYKFDGTALPNIYMCPKCKRLINCMHIPPEGGICSFCTGVPNEYEKAAQVEKVTSPPKGSV